MKIHNKKDFLLGMVTTALIGTLIVPAGAALVQKTISVHTGVNLYIDDKKFNPCDANGNPVEPFIHNGTTYLPVRAVGEAVGKTIQWEGKTHSVYIGKHESSEPAVWLADLPYFSGDSAIQTKSSENDNLGTVHYHCITDDFERTYQLNGQYSRMTGTLYQKYDKRSEIIWGVSVLEIYADGKLIQQISFPETTRGFEPQSFSVDLTGVLELKVKFISSGSDVSDPLSLGDCGLFT